MQLHFPALMQLAILEVLNKKGFFVMAKAKVKKNMVETSVQGEGVDPLTMGVRMRTVVEDGVERYEVLAEDAPVVVAEEVVATEAPAEQKKVAEGRTER